MEIQEDDIHSHCIQCIKLTKCTTPSTPGVSCDIINCPSECGARFHACKAKEHKLLCMNEKVPCINAEYGCPVVLCRKYRGRHLSSCPASIIHCSIEWDRWPVHVHKDRQRTLRSDEELSPSLQKDLDVALAMRDERMLRKCCVAAAQGQSLADQKFTISLSSSLWIFRKWQSSRENSYPPGLEQSVCKELCKTCNRTENSVNPLTNGMSNMSRTNTILDNFSINAYTDKDRSENSNQQKDEINLTAKQKFNGCVSTEEHNGKLKLPQYNLDDVLQLSQFGTIVYQSSGEGSIRVARDPIDSFANLCEDHPNMVCQILDFKFKNPSSTPPWCLSLGLDLNVESRSQHAPSNFMYTFLCSQAFRRDEYGWHYKNIHSEIHGGLNGWLVERCPLAQHGCKFSRKKFNPAPKNSYVVYNEVLESFGVAYSSDVSENSSTDSHSPNSHYSTDAINLVNLPFDVLQHIVHYLDSFSLANLSLTCSVLRDVCSTVLRDHGLVCLKWEKHTDGNKCCWKPSKNKRWFFSSHITPIQEWTFDDRNNMSDHLKSCPYFNPMVHNTAFDYMRGPIKVHPVVPKSDFLMEICEDTTKL
ncbi:F-box only protein 30-like [Uloborus diversus]|uniref:F-box only protein 30-like n=1 Tax=Uloborus diversus TaxID=327109 RepID=UPI00240915BC|nr:F-box only protein 30-like [Uloborus diversus]